MVLALLLIGLPSLNLPKAKAGEKTSGRGAVRPLIGESRVFEHKRADGAVLSRLVLSPGQSPNRLRFEIEDRRNAEKSTGTLVISSKAIKVRFQESESRSKFGIVIRPDRETGGQNRIVLFLDQDRCEITIDTRARTALSERMNELRERGTAADAARLLPEVRDAFSGGNQYLVFTRTVEGSCAFSMLSALVSLQATLAEEEVRGNAALKFIGYAASLLAPGAVKAALRDRGATKGENLKPGAGEGPIAQHNETECALCPLEAAGIIGGCFANQALCYATFPDTDWWLCDTTFWLCVDLAIAFWAWCEQTYCHPHCDPPTFPSASGDTMRVDEALYENESLFSSNGLYQFVMQGDGNLVLYRTSDGAVLWAWGTDGNPGAYCTLSSSGELGVFADCRLLRVTPPTGDSGSFLIVQDDGNVVIYRSDGVPIWATNTVQP